VSFLFDDDIVRILKNHPQSTRNYDLETKCWNVELQVLPDLLNCLESFKYEIPDELKGIPLSIIDIKNIQHAKAPTPATLTTTAITDLSKETN